MESEVNVCHGSSTPAAHYVEETGSDWLLSASLGHLVALETPDWMILNQ